MTNTSSADKEQQQYYAKEWSSLALSNAPSKSGWRTSLSAPDFLQFINWLNENNISGTALDLGCGGGRHSIVLAQNSFDTYGIDFAEAAIQTAKQAANEADVSESTHFRVGNVLSLPYKDSFFDLINDDGCLHHIDPNDWSIYLSNIQRVIKSGGILRVKAFSKNCEYYKHNTSNNSQWVHLDDSGWTYFFTEKDIKQLFAQGFKILSLNEKVHSQTRDKKFWFGILRSTQV